MPAEDNDELSLDFEPQVKLFTPDARCVWLLTDLDPDDTDLAFGLSDMGMGYPDLCYIRLSELKAIRGTRGLRVKREPDFTPTGPISEYLKDARAHGRIRG